MNYETRSIGIPKAVFPVKLFPLLTKIQINRPGIAIYRVVKVVSAL
jgi:hypothetical protein